MFNVQREAWERKRLSEEARGGEGEGPFETVNEGNHAAGVTGCETGREQLFLRNVSVCRRTIGRTAIVLEGSSGIDFL